MWASLFPTHRTACETIENAVPLLTPSFDAFPEPPESDPKWLIYQKAVARLKESYGDCEVIHDHKILGRRSGVERQVDIWLSTRVGGKHGVTVAVECKCHETSPVSIKDVDAFYGFLDDVGANKGVLVSNTGFTEGAKRRADGSELELETLTLEEAADFEWADLLDGSCQNPLDCWGTVSWQFDDGEGSHAGYCDYCSTFHIKCGHCGYKDSYREGEIIKCAGCETRWRLEDEKGITVGLERLDPSDYDDADDDNA